MAHRVAQLRAEKVALRFLEDGERETCAVTYAELDESVRAIASWLQRDCAAGERAVLLFTPSIEFITAYLGCLYAGVLPVAISPPLDVAALDMSARMIARAAPSVVLTDLPELAGTLAAAAGEPRVATGAQALRGDPQTWARPEINLQSLALLQYTSGSTRDPRPVMVTHGNLVANQERLREFFGSDDGMGGVSWLPSYHDMGLMSALHAIYIGAWFVMMSPLDFLRRPMRWLEGISRYGAQVSGGPDFAYDLCVRKGTSDQIARLDLSSWQVACNGAQPVRAETMRAFAAAFAPAGFREQAFAPCYGLAEATLFVTGVAPHESFSVVRVPPSYDDHEGRVPAAGPDRHVVACGAVVGDEVLIAGPDGEVLGEREIGEIWVAGTSVAAGYWQLPDATAAKFRARPPGGDRDYLRTGDMGFLDDGRLCVLGRIKDLIVVEGRTHYPQDIESTVERCSDRLRPGCSAAFLARDAQGVEHLVVVCELARGAEPSARLARAARKAVRAEHGLVLHDLVMAPVRTVPKTTSGKVRRAACRLAYEEGELTRGIADASGG